MPDARKQLIRAMQIAGYLDSNAQMDINEIIADGMYHEFPERWWLMYALMPTAGTILDTRAETPLDFRYTEGDPEFITSTQMMMEGQKKLIVDGDSFLDSFTAPRWLVKNWVSADPCLAQVFGQSGHGKSFLVLDLALSIATGQSSWFGSKCYPGKVLYLCGEGLPGVRKRVKAWCQAHGVEKLGDGFMVTQCAVHIDQPSALQNLKDSIETFGTKPDLVIVDTLARHMQGDESSSVDMGNFVDACGVISSEYGVCTMLVHHTGWNPENQNRGRGSSALFGALDFEMHVEKTDMGTIKLTQTKNKDAELQKALYFNLREVEIEGWLDDEGKPVTSALLEATEEPEGEEPSVQLNEKQEYDRQFIFQAFLELGNETRTGEIFIGIDPLKQFIMDKMTDGAGRRMDAKRTADAVNANQRRNFCGRLCRDQIIKGVPGSRGFLGYYLSDVGMIEKWRNAQQEDMPF